MQTLYACKDFSAYLVDSKYTGHEASTSLAGANTLARDSSHASTRSRTRRWHRGGLPGELQNQAPYTQTSSWAWQAAARRV
jgi:hypothetical protein